MKIIAVDSGKNIGLATIKNGKITNSKCLIFSGNSKRKGKTKQEERRNFRSQRRNIRRRRTTINKIKEFLDIDISQKEWSRQNPYQIRTEGLNRILTLTEILIMSVNFSKHRGFKSSHTDGKEERDSWKLVLKNEKRLDGLTPGQYIFKLMEEKSSIKHNEINGSFSRPTVIFEFDQIAEKQKSLGSKVNFADLKKIIFFQRKPYFDKATIANCKLRPQRKVARKALREFQEYKIRQQLANLRYSSKDSNLKPISNEIQEKLLTLSMSGTKTSWAKLRKIINEPNVVFNFEATEKGIFNSETDATFLKQVKTWNDIKPSVKNKITSLLLNAQDHYWSEEKKSKMLSKSCGIDPSLADEIAKVNLPAERSSLSLAAIKKLNNDEILKPVEIKISGRKYAAQQNRNNEINRRIHHVLKYIENDGPPDIILVEIVADPFVDKENVQKINDINRKNRKKAKNWLVRNNIKPTISNIRKKLLFDRQNGKTLYNNEPINADILYSSNFYNIDHVIPQSLFCDDSIDNLVLVKATANREKGNMLPNQWLSKKRFDEIKELLVQQKQLGLLKRFVIKEVPQDFAKRDLNLTAWSARLTIEALEKEIEYKGWKTKVIPITGDFTNSLRKSAGFVKNRNSHKHHLEDACLMSLCWSDSLDVSKNKAIEHKDYICDYLKQVDDKIQNFWNRSDRGKFTKDQRVKLIEGETDRRKIINGHLENVGTLSKLHFYEKNRVVKNKKTNWIDRKTKTSKDIISLKVNDVVKVVFGDVYKCYRVTSDWTLHPIEMCPDKTIRTTFFNFKNKKYVSEYRKPNYEELKNGIRLVVISKIDLDDLEKLKSVDDDQTFKQVG